MCFFFRVARSCWGCISRPVRRPGYIPIVAVVPFPSLLPTNRHRSSRSELLSTYLSSLLCTAGEPGTHIDHFLCKALKALKDCPVCSPCMRLTRGPWTSPTESPSSGAAYGPPLHLSGAFPNSGGPCARRVKRNFARATCSLDSPSQPAAPTSHMVRTHQLWSPPRLADFSRQIMAVMT